MPTPTVTPTETPIPTPTQTATSSASPASTATQVAATTVTPTPTPTFVPAASHTPTPSVTLDQPAIPTTTSTPSSSHPELSPGTRTEAPLVATEAPQEPVQSTSAHVSDDQLTPLVQPPPPALAVSPAVVATLPSLMPAVAPERDTEGGPVPMAVSMLSSERATLAIEGGKGSIGDIIVVEAVVYDAAAGIGAFELMISVDDPRAARIVGVILPQSDGLATTDTHQLPAFSVTVAGSGIVGGVGGAVERGVLAIVEIELLSDMGSPISVRSNLLQDSRGLDIDVEIQPGAVIADSPSALRLVWLLVLSGLTLPIAIMVVLRLLSRRMWTVRRVVLGKR